MIKHTHQVVCDGMAIAASSRARRHARRIKSMLVQKASNLPIEASLLDGR